MTRPDPDANVARARDACADAWFPIVRIHNTVRKRWVR
jgi:hypothetical protein